MVGSYRRVRVMDRGFLTTTARARSSVRSAVHLDFLLITLTIFVRYEIQKHCSPVEFSNGMDFLLRIFYFHEWKIKGIPNPTLTF